MTFEELRDTIFNLIEDWNSKCSASNKKEHGYITFKFAKFLVNNLEKRLK